MGSEIGVEIVLPGSLFIHLGPRPTHPVFERVRASLGFAENISFAPLKQFMAQVVFSRQHTMTDGRRRQQMPIVSEETWARRMAKREEALMAVQRSFNYNMLLKTGRR